MRIWGKHTSNICAEGRMCWKLSHKIVQFRVNIHPVALLSIQFAKSLGGLDMPHEVARGNDLVMLDKRHEWPVEVA